MEKQENLGNCDSMTTVTMKDYTPGIEYPDPPPSYKTAGGKSTAIQVAKILAISGIIIAGMLSFALIFSAWLTSSNRMCQSTQVESFLAPQLLRSALLTARDLDSSESKVAPKGKKVSSEEDSDEDPVKDVDEDDEGDETMTLLSLPLELNLHDQMFRRGDNHRGRMNCFVEKKKAEEVVDEQAKKLPPLFGVNITTDPRYLRFTGEKISISCGSGEEQRHHAEESHSHPDPSRLLIGGMEPIPHHPLIHPSPLQFHQSERNHNHHAAAASSSLPLQVIGPIPLGQQGPSLQEILNDLGTGGPGIGHMLPFLQAPEGHGGAIDIQEFGPIFFGPQVQEAGPLSQFLHLPRPSPKIKITRQLFSDGQTSPDQEVPMIVQASEIRERALHQPIPIVPRHHFPHVIRPRSVDSQDEKKPQRTKRYACNCACKDHHH